MNSSEFKRHVAKELLPGQKVVFRSDKETSMSDEYKEEAAVEEAAPAVEETAAPVEEAAPAEPAAEEKSE